LPGQDQRHAVRRGPATRFLPALAGLHDVGQVAGHRLDAGERGGRRMTDTAVRIDSELQYRIEQFYYHEAELLDEWKYNTWLDLFAADLHYWMPVRHNRLRRQRAQDETA